MTEKTPSTLVGCQNRHCGHEAYLHHWSGYRGLRGKAGRGGCGVKDCGCQGFEAPE